ncbi:MAG: M20/M25/M40 family metallo-hydrolase [Bacteroidetes bacterium]|nr:M20/M25/M40 family metallo-hydrolase [Bacteroidota bacterium]
MRFLSVIAGLTLLISACDSQHRRRENKSDVATAELLKKHVSVLAHDSLEGRLTGTIHEKKAANYIANQFKEIGLIYAPEFDGYFREFSFNTPFKLGENNLLEFMGEPLELENDWYPVPLGSSGELKGDVVNVAYGIKAQDLNFNNYSADDYSGKILLINLESPDGHHPHSKFKDYNSWRKRVEMAVAHNPSGIILHHSSENLGIEAMKGMTHIAREEMPIIHVSDSLAEILMGKEVRINGLIDLQQEEKQGINVLGYINNNAGKTVVVGAHYDHLGHGEYGNSREPNSTDIHNGADDNASGTATIIELAREVKIRGLKGNNYLFIAFSGEELGLIGSSAFCKTTGFDKLNISYMLNFDMVGRLKADSGINEIAITGTGTSPVWDSMITNYKMADVKVNTTSSGLGSSDHSSFYLEGIPAIHFFTGSHEDYHKPSDDTEKINFEGMEVVFNYAMNLLAELDNDSKLTFTKTQDKSTRSYSKLKVTLGIMPSYISNDEGLLIEAVTDGKPAQAAGIQRDDLIVRIGSHIVKDMGSYMEALMHFDKGDNTEVEVVRNGENVVLKVQF